jgi:hypothetical protein
VGLLGVRLFGPGLTVFKPGKDGGRDARFVGTPSKWPSDKDQEYGMYVLQSKHTGKEGASCSDAEFLSVMKGEKKKIRALVAAKDVSHYVVFTNRAKSAADDLAFRDDFKRIKALSRAWLVGKEHLHLLLNDHLDIWDRYEEEVKNPVRFNRDDLIKVIHSFSEFVEKGKARSVSDSLLHLRLEQKNRLNNISPEYFADLQRHSLPIFDKIRSFLENPRNETYLELYLDTADDLRGRLRRMLSEGVVPSLEEGFDKVRQEFVGAGGELKRKRRFVRVFLDYMYSTCDLGQNVETAQAPQT